MKPKPICTPSGTSRVQNVSNWQHVFQRELKVFAVVKFTAGLQKIIHVLKKKNKWSIVNLTLTPFVESFNWKVYSVILGCCNENLFPSYSWLLRILTRVLRNRSVYRLVGSEDFGCGIIKFIWSPPKALQHSYVTPRKSSAPPLPTPRR